MYKRNCFPWGAVLMTCRKSWFLPLSILFITVFVHRNKWVNKFVLSPRVCLLMIQPEVLVSGEEDSRQWQEDDTGPPLSYSLSFPPRILRMPPEEDKVRMCRDRHKEKAKTKRGRAVWGKNNTGRGQVPSTVCYLATLASCVQPYQCTHPVKLLTADNKASGHTAKFFICVYPHGKVD